MKIELVALERDASGEVDFSSLPITRRGVIRAVGVGTGTVVFQSLLVVPASGSAIDIAMYLIRKAGVLLPRVGGVIVEAVPVAAEIRAWVQLYNKGGNEQLQQKMIASLVARDGSIEDQESVAVSVPMGQTATFRVTSAPRSTGSKDILFKTEADETSVSVNVK